MLHQSKGSVAQKGFTLIEMSIVLVIIGLIIGGILKGQELINSSRQKNLVTQIDGLRAAINTFNDKYSSLPGNFNQASTYIGGAATNGSGSGWVGTNYTTTTAILGDTSNTQCTGAAATLAVNSAAENLNFWSHLSMVGLIGQSSSNCNTVPTNFGNGSILPSTAYPGAGLDVVYGLSDCTTSCAPLDTLWARFHRQVGAVVAASGAISAQDLYQIDSKYDDGTPGTGSIRSGGVSANCPIGTGTSAYIFTSQAQDCNALFQLVQ